MFAQSEGLPLMYHGWISGWLWPSSWHRSMEASGFAGIAAGTGERLSAEELKADVQVRLDDLRQQGARYFVVTMLDDFQLQPGLQDYLQQHFPLLAEKPGYLIYDLGGPDPS